MAGTFAGARYPMRKRVNAAWLQPISTDPSLLVNREDEIEELVARLEELREASIHDAHFLISGARGVGKSIFSRVALQRFEKKHSDSKWRSERVERILSIRLVSYAKGTQCSSP